MLKERFAKFKKAMQISDIALIKLAVFFFTIWIVTLVSQDVLNFIFRNQLIWFILFILLAIKPIAKFFRK